MAKEVGEKGDRTAVKLVRLERRESSRKANQSLNINLHNLLLHNYVA